MQEKLIAARVAYAGKRWRLRFALWAAFALVSLAMPNAATTEQGYLVGLIVLATIIGLLDPRPFVNSVVGVFFAALVQLLVHTWGDPEIYTAVEIIVVPIFAGPARVLVWAMIERGRTPATLMAQAADPAL